MEVIALKDHKNEGLYCVLFDCVIMLKNGNVHS